VGIGTTVTAVKHTASIEGQLAELREKLDGVEKKLAKVGDRLSKLATDTTERLTKERRERQKADATIEGKLKATALGNFGTELYGVALFGVGAFLSALSTVASN
jgi:chromosome segregation ATPase